MWVNLRKHKHVGFIQRQEPWWWIHILSHKLISLLRIYYKCMLISLIFSKSSPERHWPRYFGIYAAHTIVLWPKPKQLIIVHTSDLMMIRQCIYILSIIANEMGKLKTHSPAYCMMDNWENMLNVTRTIDRQFISSMSSDKFAQWWWDGEMYKQTNTICKPKRSRLFTLIINCTIIMKTNSRFYLNL